MSEEMIPVDEAAEPEAPRASGMYAKFATDPNLETRGVIIDYGDFRVTIARAGGTNKKFNRVLSNKTKPYERAIAQGTMDDAEALRLLQEAYAEAVVLLWEVKTGEDTWQRGIESPDGEILPFNSSNVLATFKALPDLFLDLQGQAQRMALFRKELLEEQAGN